MTRHVVTENDIDNQLDKIRKHVHDSCLTNEGLGVFGPHSLTWKYARDWSPFWSSAKTLMMQEAHPVVGKSLNDHSKVEDDPAGRWKRSFEFVNTMSFANLETALKKAKILWKVHSMFNVLKSASGRDFLSLYLNPSFQNLNHPLIVLLLGENMNIFLLAPGIAYEHRFGKNRHVGIYAKVNSPASCVAAPVRDVAQVAGLGSVDPCGHGHRARTQHAQVAVNSEIVAVAVERQGLSEVARHIVSISRKCAVPAVSGGVEAVAVEFPPPDKIGLCDAGCGADGSWSRYACRSPGKGLEGRRRRCCEAGG